jgi:hypothetical protein
MTIYEHDRAVLDCLRERRPPFSPDDVVREFAAILESYRIMSVTGDHFRGERPQERFRAHGISYQVADKPKGELYRELLPRLNSQTGHFAASGRSGLVDRGAASAASPFSGSAARVSRTRWDGSRSL